MTSKSTAAAVQRAKHDERAVTAFNPLADDEKTARAFRAVANFKKMLPGLTSFARTLTRQPDLTLDLTTGTPCTNGKVIFLRPPITLGDRLDHDRRYCGVRDEHSLRLACPACHRLDEITSTLIHEIAHIACESFEVIRDSDRRELVAKAIADRAGTPSAARIQRRVEALPSHASYVDVSAAISPFMKPLVNALEDARVNRAMYQARPGTLAMFKAKAYEVFVNGVERDDGTVARWSEAPDNAQMLVGIYAKAAGLDYRGWFKTEVEEALNDRELTRELANISTARSMASVYRLAFPVLEHVRRLGYCAQVEDPEEDEPIGTPEPTATPSESQPESDDSDDQSDDSDGTDTDDESDDTDDESDDADADSTDTDGEGDPTEGEDEGEGGYGDDDEESDDADGGEDEGDGAAGDDDESDADDGTETDGAGMSTGDTDESSTDEDGDGEGQPGDDTGESAEGASSDDDSDDEGMGDADEAENILNRFNGHDESHKMTPEYEADQAEVNRAIVQSEHFDTPSRNVFGLNLHRHDSPIISANGVNRTELLGWNPSRIVSPTIDCPESLLNRSLMKMRLVFAANRKSKPELHKRSGKVTAKHLYKVSTGDDRVFSRTRQPGKRDYFVVLSLDISGSTASGLMYSRDKSQRLIRIDLIKQAALAQAELLHRTGVKFAIYAHTGLNHVPNVTGAGRAAAGGSATMDVDIFVIKDAKDAWDNAARERLRALTPGAYNLDGHVMEFLRKTAERSTATDRLILYYTDGSMPLENAAEELPILQREIKTCRAKGITLVGVGVGCDDPIKHGLDTVRIDGIEDLPKLVGELESRLTK